MSVQKIAALIVIFFSVTVAWIVLASTTLWRTSNASSSLKNSMESTYGGELEINAPSLYRMVAEEVGNANPDKQTMEDYAKFSRDEPTLESKDGSLSYYPKYATLESSDINIDIKLDRRKKGYLWFPTFKAHFKATYQFVIDGVVEGEPYYISTIFASSNNIYTNVKVSVNGKEVDNIIEFLTAGRRLLVTPDHTGKVNLFVEYDATGMEQLEYRIAAQYRELTQVNNFNCVITTDFTDYDFPRNMLSPTTKEDVSSSAKLIWTFSNILTGKDIGLVIPNNLNYGEITSRVSFFAPIPLLFFFVVLLIISVVTKQDIHAMHFFFLALSFFSFHLMFSYFSDQMSIYLSFGVACVVSLGLTVSYIMHFLSKKMAFVIVPLTQIVYLFIFSLSFFFDGITGFIVTICAVITLFILMQLTAKLNWHEVFNSRKD